MGSKKPAAKKQMPAFSKAPAAIVATFHAALGGVGPYEPRTMFGYPSAFVNGNMFACVFQDRIMVRLAEADRAEALAIEGAKLFEPMPGRPMREYAELPARIVTKASALAGWMKRGRAYASSLPAKAPKAPRRR